jgi:DNA (cytosine-5)-methyltransferase 1
VGENVLGLVNWNGGMVFQEVQADLEAEGYEVQPYVLPAAAVNAPHRRDRVWFVAFKDTNKDGWGSEQRKEESCKWEQRNSCTRDNEWISTNYEKVRTTSNPSSDGFDDKPPTTNNIIGQDNIESGTQRERTIKGLSNEWNAADTDSRGLEGSVEVGRNCEYVIWENVTSSQTGDATDTEVESGRGELFKQQKQREFRRCNSINEFNNWHNFPTVSPICIGDDGISNRLDSITFPKWRNESIKAGGNAIVPQVVFQIFKAIELFTIQNKSNDTNSSTRKAPVIR